MSTTDELELFTEDVNGKTLTGFRHYDGTKIRETAREILENDDSVVSVDEGRETTVWVKQSTLHWKPPEGWQISSVSPFLTDEYDTASVAIDIEPIDD